MRKLCIVIWCLYTLLVVGSLGVCAQERAKSIDEVNINIRRAKDAASQQIAIDTGLEIINSTSVTDINGELAFVDYVAARREYGDVKPIFDALYKKYRGDNQSLLRIANTELLLQRNPFNPAPPADIAVTIQRTKQILEAAIADQAMLTLRSYLALGTYHASIPDDTSGENRRIAREYLRMVLDYPILDYIKSPYYRDMQAIYIAAASMLLTITPESEVAKIVLYPFAWKVIDEMHPTKAKLIPRVFPQVARYNATIFEWLVLSLRDTDEADPIYKHLEEVLKAFKEGKISR